MIFSALKFYALYLYLKFRLNLPFLLKLRLEKGSFKWTNENKIKRHGTYYSTVTKIENIKYFKMKNCQKLNKFSEQMFKKIFKYPIMKKLTKNARNIWCFLGKSFEHE